MPASKDVSPAVDCPDDRVDRTLEAMADQDRRTIVAEVAAGGRTTVDDLAKLLANGDGTERTAKIRLVHCHLPMLASADTVSYDREEGVVEPPQGASDLTATVAADGAK